MSLNEKAKASGGLENEAPSSSVLLTSAARRRGGRKAGGEMMGGNASCAPGQAQRADAGASHFGENTAKSAGPCTDNSSESFPVPTSDVYIIYDDVVSLRS